MASPAPAPAPAPDYEFEWHASPMATRQRMDYDLSPPLIAMVAVLGTAFLVVVYYRFISRYVLPPLIDRLRHRRRSRGRSFSDVESSSGGGTGAFETAIQFRSPYGLDDAAIKSIPLSVYTRKKKMAPRRSTSAGGRECAVCLVEFEDEDRVRTLPTCGHAFHVDCIDVWLRSHANCPLCRSGIFLAPQSPLVPLMAARIPPTLDDGILLDSILTDEILPATDSIHDADPRDPIHHPHHHNRSDTIDFFMTRSYSFGFERTLAAERLVLDTTTVSPWRYPRNRIGFWSKRPSPFGSAKSRVFSFRSYRPTAKSPFSRRRGFFPVSESAVRYGGGGGGSWRRSKSVASPWFVTSRLRCGDPEALVSPERLKSGDR